MKTRPWKTRLTAALLIAAAACALLSCSASEQRTEQHEIAAFGTRIELTLRADRHTDSAQAVAAVDRMFQRMHRQWHAWQPGMLGDINAAIAAGRPIQISQQTRTIMQRAARLEEKSDGLFNPAMGRLFALWGFHSDARPTGPPPDRDEIRQRIDPPPSMADLSFKDNMLSSTSPAVQLDFGAFLAGVAAENALTILGQHGITHAIVNIGGDLGVVGTGTRRAWRTAVQHPDGQGRKHLAHIDLKDGEFVFTSGNYHRYRQHEGLRYGHLIDPRSGYPAGSVQSVTVIDTRGGRADAAATALAVAGADEWQAVARRMGVEQVLRAEADGTVVVTRAMAHRIKWQQAPQRLRVVSSRAASQ